MADASQIYSDLTDTAHDVDFSDIRRRLDFEEEIRYDDELRLKRKEVVIAAIRAGYDYGFGEEFAMHVIVNWHRQAHFAIWSLFNKFDRGGILMEYYTSEIKPISAEQAERSALHWSEIPGVWPWPWLKPDEICCGSTGRVYIEPAVCEAFEDLREFTGSPIQITSGYRTPARNADVGGARNSQHLKGLALDLDMSTHMASARRMIDKAEELGFTGRLEYANRKFLHIDMRSTNPVHKVVAGRFGADWHSEYAAKDDDRVKDRVRRTTNTALAGGLVVAGSVAPEAETVVEPVTSLIPSWISMTQGIIALVKTGGVMLPVSVAAGYFLWSYWGRIRLGVDRLAARVTGRDQM